MWYSVRTAEGATVARFVSRTNPSYQLPAPVAAPPAAARRATSRSRFTGYDATGQKYDLCPTWYEQVWGHTRGLVPAGWQPPRSVDQHSKPAVSVNDIYIEPDARYLHRMYPLCFLYFT